MPYRYTDVNIKLHQYQGWKSGGLEVLRGFKETVLVAKGKQTFSSRGWQCTKISKQRHHSMSPLHFTQGKKRCSYCSAALLQNGSSLKCFDEAGIDQRVPKLPSPVTIAYPQCVSVCWLQGLGVLPSSLCLIQHANRGSHTRKSCNCTPTLQYYSSQTLSIFSLMTLFCVFVQFILQDIFIVLVSQFIINSLSDIVCI